MMAISTLGPTVGRSIPPRRDGSPKAQALAATRPTRTSLRLRSAADSPIRSRDHGGSELGSEKRESSKQPAPPNYGIARRPIPSVLIVAHVEFALAAAAIPLGLSVTKVWSGEIGERRKTERHRETQLKSCAYHCLRRIWLAARRPMILESGDIDCLGKPVVVLSNDGGCVIARSNQVGARWESKQAP
jgi:hypothetical protein